MKALLESAPSFCHDMTVSIVNTIFFKIAAKVIDAYTKMFFVRATVFIQGILATVRPQQHPKY